MSSYHREKLIRVISMKLVVVNEQERYGKVTEKQDVSAGPITFLCGFNQETLIIY